MVLGDVMAHELGHLMLRSHKQSLDGIMRPGIEKREMAITTFTKAEAREVAASMRALSDWIPHTSLATLLTPSQANG